MALRCVVGSSCPLITHTERGPADCRQLPGQVLKTRASNTSTWALPRLKHWSSWVHKSTPPDLDPPPTFNWLMFLWCMWAQAHICHRTTPAVRTQPTRLVLSFHQGSRVQVKACVASHQPLAFHLYIAFLCGSDKQQSPVHKPGQVIYFLVFETGSQSWEPCYSMLYMKGLSV